MSIKTTIHETAKANLEALVSAIKTFNEGNEKWPKAEALDSAHQHIENHFERDCDHLEDNAAFLRHPIENTQEITKDITHLFYIWQAHGVAPSLYALCVKAMEDLDLNPSPDMLSAVLMAALLGEIENDQPYHNNMHFKKVLLHLIIGIKAHQEIYEGSARTLDTSEICLLLIAACIHDLGHDGQGNTVRGVHMPGRAEKYSFDLAEPYLKIAGLHDQNHFDALLVMLLTTDVSPLDDPGNPMHQMKAAYRFHFLGENSKTHSLNLSDELELLEKDPRLSTMSLLLHEADIATSAGLSYDVTQYETSLLREEFCADHGKPSHIINFLEQICGRRFLSDAGQKLYAANMARIYTLAEEDMKAGDHEFAGSALSAFILGESQNEIPKTIN